MIKKIPIPGTQAFLEIDAEKIVEREVFTELPDLVPYSGENFGKPKLHGDEPK